MKYIYNDSDELLKDYFSGFLKNRLIYYTEKNTSEAAVAYLNFYYNTVENFLETLRQREGMTYHIIRLFYGQKYEWIVIANYVNLSESAAQRRNYRTIEELNSWIGVEN